MPKCMTLNDLKAKFKIFVADCREIPAVTYICIISYLRIAMSTVPSKTTTASTVCTTLRQSKFTAASR